MAGDGQEQYKILRYMLCQ